MREKPYTRENSETGEVCTRVSSYARAYVPPERPIGCRVFTHNIIHTRQHTHPGGRTYGGIYVRARECVGNTYWSICKRETKPLLVSLRVRRRRGHAPFRPSGHTTQDAAARLTAVFLLCTTHAARVRPAKTKKNKKKSN